MMSERPQEVVGTPFDMDLETGKLLEFERATKSSALAQSADGERFIAPTFLMAAAFWRTPASDVLDYSQ
jgi:hypothetical protein